MNKTDLIAKVAEDADISKAAAERALDAVVSNIQSALAAGDSVTLVGFGTFKVGERAARVGRNPKTGKAIEIDASRTPKFTAGSKFKAAVAK